MYVRGKKYFVFFFFWQIAANHTLYSELSTAIHKQRKDDNVTIKNTLQREYWVKNNLLYWVGLYGL